MPNPEHAACDSGIYGCIAFIVYGFIVANGLPYYEAWNKIDISLQGCTEVCSCTAFMFIQAGPAQTSGPGEEVRFPEALHLSPWADVQPGSVKVGRGWQVRQQAGPTSGGPWC